MKELFKLFVIIALSFLLSSNSFSLPVTVNGSVSIDYPDLTSAFDAINAGTHGSGAITVLINESHTLTSTATLNGGIFTSCEIKPTADVIIDGDFTSALITLDGADRVTIDGRIGTVDAIKLTLTNLYEGIEIKNGATDNVIKFIQCNNTSFYPVSVKISQSISGAGGNNNNSVEDSNLGHIVSEGTGGTSGYTNGGTKILGNKCEEIVLVYETRDNDIRNNICKKITLWSVGTNNIIENKVWRMSIKTTNITAPGSSITEVNILNNFVVPFIFTQTPFSGEFEWHGIEVSGNNSVNILYNTVYVYGQAHQDFFVFGLYMDLRSPGTFNVKNNIIINTFVAGGPYDGFCTAAYFKLANPDIIMNLDYNCYINLYNGTNVVLNNLATSDINVYRAAAFPNEQHTIFKNVDFAFAYQGDLHLAGASIMDEELQGVQIPGITTDIDGDLRNSPFMGADEADYLLPVELTSFTSSVINNDVHLNWTTASETNNSGFDIERRDVRGETQDVWSKISFINGHGTTSSPNNYEFTDKGLNAGKYKYRLKQIDFNGNYEYFSLANEVVVGVPEKYSLSQNYPNPFNPTTNLEFGISDLDFVSLKVYNVLGIEVATLVNDELSPGIYEVKFDGSNLSSGVYFYKLTAGEFSAVKKMFLMK